MSRALIAIVSMAASLVAIARAQPDPQTALWTAIKKQLSGPDGKRYFETNVKDAALPWLKGTLASALINEGVSRVILKMPGSPEPDVTLVVHNRSAKLKSRPTSGTMVEFQGVAVAFTTTPFMLTFDVELDGLRGLDFVRPAAKSEDRKQ